MMESKKPINAMQARAEAKFEKMVAETITYDPMSVTRPLKYRPGSHVLIENTTEIAEVQKGDAGVYLIHLKSGESIVCRESDITTIN